MRPWAWAWFGAGAVSPCLGPASVRTRAAVRALAPYRHGVHLDLRVVLQGSNPVEVEDLGDLLDRKKDGWVIATVAVEVPPTAPMHAVRREVAAQIETLLDVDVVSVSAAGAATHAVLRELLTETLLLPRLRGPVCVVQGRSASSLSLDAEGFALHLADPDWTCEASVHVRSCSPFACELEDAQARLLAAVVALERVMLSAKQWTTASDVATLPAVMPVIDLMAPNIAGANGTNGTGGACECYIGKLTLRAFFLLGFKSDSVSDFLARIARDDVAPGDVTRALAGSLIGGASKQAHVEEGNRFHGTDAWWLTARRSVSLNALLESGWPIFRILEFAALRSGRPIESGFPTEPRCDKPLVEELRDHLWLALEAKWAFQVGLLNEFYRASRARPSEPDCVLALASATLAQATLVQCRAARGWKARQMFFLSLSAVSEFLDELVVRGPRDAAWILRTRWPIWSLLARISRTEERIRQHTKALPTHPVARMAVQSSATEDRVVVSFGAGEGMLLGGNWAQSFAAEVFGHDQESL